MTLDEAKKLRVGQKVTVKAKVVVIDFLSSEKTVLLIVGDKHSWVGPHAIVSAEPREFQVGDKVSYGGVFWEVKTPPLCMEDGQLRVALWNETIGLDVVDPKNVTLIEEAKQEAQP
jgi:hypothetical protein